MFNFIKAEQHQEGTFPIDSDMQNMDQASLLKAMLIFVECSQMKIRPESKTEIYHAIVGNDSFSIFLATLWSYLHLRTFHKYQHGLQ